MIATLSGLVENHITTNNPNFSGVILIGHKDEILMHRSYGSDIALNSQFIISSITKQITAALILKYFKEHKRDLNETIDRFLPNLKNVSAKNVTVHHLLTHTSGIVEFEKGEFKFSPSEKYDYSNLGYNILGMILESLTHRKYQELVSEFLTKYDMNSTYVTGEGKIKEIQGRIPGLVSGYDKDETGKLTPVNSHRMAIDFPSKGLVSNALDLFKWNRLLNQGKIIDKYEYSKMVQPHTQISDKMNYGYGLEISRHGNLTEISHNGETHGYLTTVLYYPESEISVIMLGNHFPFHSDWVGPGNEEIICQEQNAIREIVRGYLIEERPSPIVFKFNANRSSKFTDTPALLRCFSSASSPK